MLLRALSFLAQQLAKPRSSTILVSEVEDEVAVEVEEEEEEEEEDKNACS